MLILRGYPPATYCKIDRYFKIAGTYLYCRERHPDVVQLQLLVQINLFPDV